MMEEARMTKSDMRSIMEDARMMMEDSWMTIETFSPLMMAEEKSYAAKKRSSENKRTAVLV